MKFLLVIRYIITLPLLLITLLTTPPAVSTESAPLLSTDVFVFDQALIMGQGITTDGEHYYTSGTITSMDLTAVAKLTVDGMKHIGDIELTGLGVIERIQGGEFCDGKLYLSQDVKNKGNLKNILSVDIETGEVSLVAERNVGKENTEAEGMTFTEGEDGPVLHVLDYNKVVGMFVHHYDVDF